ncbi:DMT family transporter [Dongia sp.]|uniref:DMT family transporter n=1 Tax=Dongia sp. TaxID=1977262 RepID=UPI0035B0B195
MNRNTYASGFTIHPNLGSAMAIVAVIAGVGMDVLAKTAAFDASPAQVTLLRWIYGIATLGPILIIMRVRPGSPLRPIYLLRALLNLVASFSLYYALAHLPLSLTVAIFFLEPLVALTLAAILLKEHVSLHVIAGIGIAILGIAVMVACDGAGIADWRLDPAILVALLGAVAWGTMLVTTRSIGRQEPVLSLMFWLSVTTSIGMAPIAALDWRPLDIEAHLYMLGVAVLGTCYGVLGITVLRHAPVRVKAASSFLSLPLAFVAGFAFFGEVPASGVVLGGFLVLLGVYGALRRPRLEPPLAPESP